MWSSSCCLEATQIVGLRSKGTVMISVYICAKEEIMEPLVYTLQITRSIGSDLPVAHLVLLGE